MSSEEVKRRRSRWIARKNRRVRVLENVAGACHVVGPSEQLPLAIENGGHALERHVRRLVLQPDVDLGIELEAVDAGIAEEFGDDDLIALSATGIGRAA